VRPLPRPSCAAAYGGERAVSRRARMFWPLTLGDEVLKFDSEAMFAEYLEGVWFVVRFRPSGRTHFVCDVRRLDLSEVAPDDVQCALRSFGYVMGHDEDIRALGKGVRPYYPLDGQSVRLGKDGIALKVACAIEYGLGAVIHTAMGHTRNEVFNSAIIAANRLMDRPSELEEVLDLPHDWYGGTVREVGAGYLGSPKEQRVLEYYIDPFPGCTLGILHPTHYWPNRVCKCSDVVHQGVMLELGWSDPVTLYSIPVRKFTPEGTRVL
jgi:hypothetical protein